MRTSVRFGSALPPSLSSPWLFAWGATNQDSSPLLSVANPPQKKRCLRRSSQNTKTEHFSSVVQAAVNRAVPPAWRCCFASFILCSWCDKIKFFPELQIADRFTKQLLVMMLWAIFFYFFAGLSSLGHAQPVCAFLYASVGSWCWMFNHSYGGYMSQLVRWHVHEFLLLFKFLVLVVQFSLMETHFQGPIIYTFSDI